MSATPDGVLANPEQFIADLNRQLAECKVERDQAVEQQTATTEVLQVINSSPSDLAPVFSAILERATRLCEADFGIFLTYDGERFHTVALHNVPEPYAQFLKENPPQPGPESAIGRILRGECVVRINDVTQDQAYFLGDPRRRAIAELGRARSYVAVGLHQGEKLLGTLAAYRQEVRPFSDKQIELLQNFAVQAAIAMENAGLLTATRDALEQQSAAAEVLQIIKSSAGNLSPVFEAILDKALLVCEADFGTLWGYDGEKMRASAVRGAPPRYLEFLSKGPHRPSRIAHQGLLSGEQVAHIVDITTTDAYRDGDRLPRAVADLGGVRTLLAAPLKTASRLIGILSIYRQLVRPFSDRQITLLRNFADQAVIAMENARLLTETRERTEELTQREAALRASEERYALAMRGINEGVYEWDVATGEMYYSPRVCDLVGLQASELRTLADWTERIHPDDRAGYRKAILAHFKGESDRLVAEYRYRHADGTWHWARQHGIALRNESGRAYRVVGSAGDISDRKAAEYALREALDQQTATAEVLGVINSSPGNLQPVFDAILEKARVVCGFAQGSLNVFDGEYFRTVTTRGVPEAFAEILRQPRRSGPQARFLEGNRIVHISDLRAEAQRADDPVYRAAIEAGIRTVLFVPLQKEQQLLGYITANRREVRPFSDKQIALLQNFAAQAVIAMENARLLTETREALEQQTATAEVLQAINSSPGDLAPVFEAMLEKAIRLCSGIQGALWTLDGEHVQLAASHGNTPEFVSVLRERAELGAPEAVRETMRSGRLLHVPNLIENELYQAGDPIARGAVELSGVRSLVGVPLVKDGASVGAFMIGRREVRPFSDKQVALLQNFAAQAVIAMENARLLTETREALEHQTATAEVLQVVNSSPGDLAPVFDAILERAMRLCDVAHGHVLTIENGRGRVVAARGEPEFVDWIRQRGLINPLPGGLLDRVMRGERVIHTPDATDSDVYRGGTIVREIIDKSGIRTSLAVALHSENVILGAIIVSRQEVQPFSDKQIALLQNFAAQAVIAMENARLIEEIRQRQAELRVTFDNMGDGVVMFDEGLRLAAWNPNFQELLDLPDAVLAQRPSYAEYLRILAERGEFGSGDIEEELQRRLAETEQELRLERTRPDGRVIEVRRNAVPGGGFVLIYSDITERKEAEARLRTARDTAEGALRELRAAQANLIHAEKMASLGQLTAGIAHEIKNPLNFVNNFAGLSVELLEELKVTAAPAVAALGEDERAEIDELVTTLSGNLDKIAEHGRRADGIVTSMLAHSRGGSGERRPVDLNALVDEALNLAYHGARARDQSFDVVLERDFDRTVQPFELVPQDITRVLLNLISNGFYAASTKPQATQNGKPAMLKVTTRDLGETVEIGVRDNGAGIPPEIRDKLFQPFFTTKPTGEGTGLGLSISWDIVAQQHGGTIEVDSRPGEFTEFTIRLPRSFSSAPKEKSAAFP
jgi:two-component system, NtrC family, sensor kinase